MDEIRMPSGDVFKSGDYVYVSNNQNGGDPLFGAIHIDIDQGRMWICSNSEDLNGSTSPDKHGFKYSYVVSASPGEIEHWGIQHSRISHCKKCGSNVNQGMKCCGYLVR